MSDTQYRIRYPRRRLIRAVFGFIGRWLVALLGRLTITGRARFPQRGPLIIIANHVDTLDGILLALFTPYLAEAMIAADLPFPAVARWILNVYGHIPVLRGAADGAATRMALSVLEQGGIVILFPEGAIWRPAGKEVHTGVAWLSQKAQAPVLPIGLIGTRNAMPRAFQLKRPKLEMCVGELITPVPPSADYDKAYLQQHANSMMSAVEALIPPEERQQVVPVDKLRFGFAVTLHDAAGQSLTPSAELASDHAVALGKLYYDLALLATLRDSMKLPVQPLLEPGKPQDVNAIKRAIDAMLVYLDKEYAHFFTYRFGKTSGEAMRAGFEVLRHMAHHMNGGRMTLLPSFETLADGESLLPISGD